MKLIRYIQYFFYVGIHWGWGIAFAIVRQEIAGEKKYGINSTGADELKKLKKEGVDISHATMYMPVSYTLLEQSLEQIDPVNRKHFLDIGCGKGRAMCVAAVAGFTRVSGVDFSAAFCREAIANLAIIKQRLPATQFLVAEQDAARYAIPGDTDCIFLFNPFDEMIMKKVVNNILKSLQTHPRIINVIYANPLYKSLFLEHDFKEVYYSKTMEQFEVAILNCRY